MSDVWEVEASGRKVVSQKGNMASCSTCISDLKAAKLDLFVLVHCREGGVCFTADGGAEAKCEDSIRSSLQNLLSISLYTTSLLSIVMSSTPAKDTKEEKHPVSNGDDKKPNGDAEKPTEPILTVEDGLFPTSLLLDEILTEPFAIETLNNISLIGRGVASIEPRFTIRVLRTLTTLRKKLTKTLMRSVLDHAFPKGCKPFTRL